MPLIRHYNERQSGAMQADLELGNRAEDELDLTYMGFHAQPQRFSSHQPQIHLQIITPVNPE